MSEWISVEERLPEEDKFVLCWCPLDSSGEVIILSQHNSFFMDEFFSILAPSHWMPLPEPPK